MNKPVAIDTARIEPAAPVVLVPKPPAATPAGPRFRKSWLIAGLSSLAMLAAVGVVWWLATAEATVSYTTAPVTRGAVTRAVTATGTVNPVLTIIVGTYVSGVIQRLECDYNTIVQKGQVCATLDQARAQVGVDEADIALHEAQLATAQVNLDYTNIVSPVDGTVVSRNVTMGQTVAASFQTPTLFLIATDLTKMQVDTNVSESDIGGITDGDKSIFTVDAFPKRTFEGTVSQVRQSPQTVQNVVTYDVVVSIDNADLALKPGMTAANRIITDQRADVLRVPSQALRYAPVTAAGTRRSGTSGRTRPAEQGRVWVLRDGKAVRVAVTTGLDDDTYTEIVKGELKADDQVIIAEQRTNSSKTAPPRLP